MPYEPHKILGPHLDRWVNIGLLSSFVFTRSEGGQRRWLLTWHDGRVSEWSEQQVRAAIYALDKLERKLADA